jgi:hypothetical protein
MHFYNHVDEISYFLRFCQFIRNTLFYLLQKYIMFCAEIVFWDDDDDDNNNNNNNN